MIIKPKTRGFICTTAHPEGCAQNVKEQVDYAKAHKIDGPSRVLVIGSSTGYGLASRIAATFSGGADTVGVFFERPSSGTRTATAGWYNNLAFERLAAEAGRIARSVNGDAFSSEVKAETAGLVKNSMPGGQVDLVVYSLAAPKRTDPATGKTYTSAIKPVGRVFDGKTVDFHTGEVSRIAVQPARDEELEHTVAVMGGADWLLWIQALREAGVLAQGAGTVAFSYLGPELTHPIYMEGTIGHAKEDLEKKCGEIDRLLAPIGGKAFVSVNKALVTQASSAIPVVPLYISLLYKVMKEAGTHEDCIRQMVRMFADRLYKGGCPADWAGVPVDERGRIRMDDREMDPAVQRAVAAAWDGVTTENLEQTTDIAGYRDDFFRLFGFGLAGVDYDADITEY